jgi:ribosome-associated toxin RatA of RatAB toxin-antitoxin module
MTSIHRSALLPYSASQVFALVNDVEAYPRFMDGCVGAEVIHSDEQHMEARLDLARGGISQSFTTINELHPYESIRLTLKDGPFEFFDGAWRFQRAGGAGLQSVAGSRIHGPWQLAQRCCGPAA